MCSDLQPTTEHYPSSCYSPDEWCLIFTSHIQRKICFKVCYGQHNLLGPGLCTKAKVTCCTLFILEFVELCFGSGISLNSVPGGIMLCPAGLDGGRNLKNARSHIFYISRTDICGDLCSVLEYGLLLTDVKMCWVLALGLLLGLRPFTVQENILHSFHRWLCAVLLAAEEYTMQYLVWNSIECAALPGTQASHYVRSHIFHSVYCGICGVLLVISEWTLMLFHVDICFDLQRLLRFRLSLLPRTTSCILFTAWYLQFHFLIRDAAWCCLL